MDDIIRKLLDLRYLQWSKTRKSSGTAGSFLKSYDDTEERKLYYKLSDYDIREGVIGHECVNEIIAQRMLTLLHIPHLTYTLLHAKIIVEDTELVTWLCRSEDFKLPGESKLPLEDYYALEKKDGESPLDFCLRLHWENTIYGMLVIDHLIINRDRHGANLEVLINRRNQTIRLTPLFDQGLSLVCRCHTEEELARFDPLEDRRIQSFVGSQSTFENLKLIPGSWLRQLPKLSDEEISSVTNGLVGVLSKPYTEKIREILIGRWHSLETL